jgi:polyisoprenyl-phosphate glycosyltransferase
MLSRFQTLRPAGTDQPTLSVVVPCYNEERNLLPLYERLCAVLSGAGVDWELVVVDDHSTDLTFAVASELAEKDNRVFALRLARNVGSHVALMCGLDHSLGKAAVILAADMQDPPETILDLLARWRGGDQVVWAVRRERKGISTYQGLASRLYYKLMARIIGRSELVGQGADVFLVDRLVISALTQCSEGNLSLFSLVLWLGFRQSTITYVKEERLHGRSGWTFRKKLKLFVDSVTAFSYFPIRAMSMVGVAVALAGFGYALFIIGNNLISHVPVEGWSSLMVVVLVLGGLQMTMLGLLGEYLWRTLDEARRRPRYNVERSSIHPDVRSIAAGEVGLKP